MLKERKPVLDAVERAGRARRGSDRLRCGLDREQLGELHLLTAKPFLYVFNMDEEELGDDALKTELRAWSHPPRRYSSTPRSRQNSRSWTDRGARAAPVHGPAGVGARHAGSGRLRHPRPADLLTAGPKEARAWTIRRARRRRRAGVIHTDFQRGFIKAEVVVRRSGRCRPLAEAKARGLLRIEGKDYVMSDGDVVEFRHGPTARPSV